MRTPTYLSYSSISLFEKNPDEFYLKYLAKHRPKRLPQTNAMSVGSAFDAFVKSRLHSDIFGEGSDPEYALDKLFEDQVEEQNRDFAFEAGKHCFEAYHLTGAYEELRALLLQSTEPPRFECSLTGDIAGAPFLGKPDCRFVLDFGEGRISIVLDWKVKSYCSKHAASPTKGYMMCRDGYKGAASRSNGKAHKLFLPMSHRGLTINQGFMEDCSTNYADQCMLYAWLLGEPVGEDTTIFIDELCAKPILGDHPQLRIANHRARVRPQYQQELLTRVDRCWSAIEQGHIFLDLSKEESIEKQESLEEIAIGLLVHGGEDNWFNEVTRPQFMR